MEEQLTRIENKLDDLNDKHKQVYHRIVGNPDLKQPGLIDDVNKNTNHRKKTGWFITIFTGIGAGIMWLVEWIKEHV